MAGKTVAVTGANGYVASVLVKQLLERGCTVRGTARNPDDLAKVGHLWELRGAEERLKLYKADLLVDGDYDEVVHGTDGVFHVAASILLQATDPQSEIIDPSLKGTLNVLKSAAKSKSVKRVVYTSSFVTLVFNSRALEPDTLVDESWWSSEETCTEMKLWYPLGKTLAEQAAWDFAKDNTSFDLVTILPAIISGGEEYGSLNYCSRLVLDILGGEKVPLDSPPWLNSTWVDINDVAFAHILAFEASDAEGRHICVAEVVKQTLVASWLKKLFPQYPVQVPDLGKDEDAHNARPFSISNTKLQNLGWEVRPFEESLNATVESLREKGFLK